MLFKFNLIKNTIYLFIFLKKSKLFDFYKMQLKITIPKCINNVVFKFIIKNKIMQKLKLNQKYFIICFFIFFNLYKNIIITKNKLIKV